MIFVDGVDGLPSAARGASNLAALLTEKAGTELGRLMAGTHARCRASLAQLVLLAPQPDATDLTSAMIASSPEVAASVLELAMNYIPSMDRGALASVLGGVCRR